MGIITDIIKGLPLTAIQAEKLSELGKKLEALEAENSALKEKLRHLEKSIAPKCPRCKGEFEFLHETQASYGDVFGLKDRIYRCTSCGFEEARQYDPLKI